MILFYSTQYLEGSYTRVDRQHERSHYGNNRLGFG
jgi:hypothetical protein